MKIFLDSKPDAPFEPELACGSVCFEQVAEQETGDFRYVGPGHGTYEQVTLVAAKKQLKVEVEEAPQISKWGVILWCVGRSTVDSLFKQSL